MADPVFKKEADIWEFAVRQRLLLMLKATHINYHHCDCLNLNLTRTTIDGVRSGDLNVTQITTGRRNARSKIVFPGKRMQTGYVVQNDNS